MSDGAFHITRVRKTFNVTSSICDLLSSLVLESMAATLPIPFIYRLTFHYIEPFAAFLGGASVILTPKTVLLAQTPSAGSHYVNQLRPLTLQIAGGWFLLSFIDAFLLRHTNDRKIWRLVMTAGFISDLCYITSIWMDLGNTTLFNPRLWDAEKGFTIVSTILPMMAKVAFILGIGTGEKIVAKTKNA